jgi:NADH-quinone oxidoreductase subunit H
MKFGMFYFAEYMEVCTSSMLLVTIFLGGWSLPFIHRDGLSISFGDAVLVQQPLLHYGVEILGVLAFFGKTLVVCWFQAFVRWSLPRFRYDQLMNLGWKALLPAALANLFVTGIVLLLVDNGGPQVAAAFKVLGDVSQAVVAIAITTGVVMLVVGMFGRRKHRQSLVGSSAKYAEELGGVKETPMQA